MADAQDHRLVERSADELQTNWEPADEAAGKAERWEPGQVPGICETPASMKYVLCLAGNLHMTLRSLPRAQREGGGRKYVDAVERGPDLLDQYPPWLINAFMLVLVAGVSLGNLAIAALVLGGAQVLASAYGNPVLGSLTIVILAVIILRFRTITI